MLQTSVIRTRHRRGSRAMSHWWARATSHILGFHRFHCHGCGGSARTLCLKHPFLWSPPTVAIRTVSPETAFLSITVTLTPGNELTFGLLILKQHLMVVHINQLYHVQPLNQNPQDLTLPPIFYFSWHLLFPYTGKKGSDAKCLWSASTELISFNPNSPIRGWVVSHHLIGAT